ncbi:hypothetical protein PV433_27370 [Paenibacillus sp. GYB004]|uniref:hypothetical protein n=1 Tax=Paenibacillus sp. GYB004 TaxID=2994393 RepID=UPI002F96E157
MTPYLLQDALVAEIKALFADTVFKNSLNELGELNVYPQFLPAKQSEDDAEHFPYAIVRVLSGGTEDEQEASTCKVLIFFGLYDDDPNYQGYKDILNMLRRLETHLYRKRIIDNRYRIEYPFDWSVYDEDAYPYYFGGAETTWTLPAVRQEEVFL